MTTTLTKPEQGSLLTIAIMGAFADGAKSDLERTEIKRISESLREADLNLSALYQQVLLRQVRLADAAAALASPEARQLAYEMAVCVCEADDTLNDAEKAFLADLRRELGLDEAAAAKFEQEAEALAQPPVIASASAVPPAVNPPGRADQNEVDRLILNYSILNGGLELLPDSLATMAIIPLQMKMVFRIGKHYGYDLDRGHIVELLGAAGVGMTSQVVEGFARKLLGGLLGKVGGGLGRRVGDQVASSAMSFASTYALGQMAQRYYAGGRQLSAVQMRQLFSSFTQQAQSLHSRYAGEIQNRASTLNPAKLLDIVHG